MMSLLGTVKTFVNEVVGITTPPGSQATDPRPSPPTSAVQRARQNAATFFGLQPVLDELVVTDTIPLSDAAKNTGKIRQVTIAPMLAEALRRINNEESLSAMFDIM